MPTEEGSIGSDTNIEKNDEKTAIHTKGQYLDSTKIQSDKSAKRRRIETSIIPVVDKGLDSSSNMENYSNYTHLDMQNTVRVCNAITPPDDNKIIESTSTFDCTTDESTTIHATGLGVPNHMEADSNIVSSEMQIVQTKANSAPIIPNVDKSIGSNSANQHNICESTAMQTINHCHDKNNSQFLYNRTKSIAKANGSNTQITICKKADGLYSSSNIEIGSIDVPCNTHDDLPTIIPTEEGAIGSATNLDEESGETSTIQTITDL